MSGSNVQGAPTASMTISAGQESVFSIGFGYYPQEGSRCVSAQYNWTAQLGYFEDLSQLVARGVETAIQAVYIDNTTCPQIVTMTIGGTGQLIVCPANSQGVFPCFFTGTPQFTLSVASASASVTRLYLLNVPAQAAGVWQQTAAGTGTVTVGGTYQSPPVELIAGGTQGLLLDAYGSLMVDTESNVPTYSAACSFTPAAAATDIFVIGGSATKTIRVHQMVLVLNSAGLSNSVAVSLIKRSAANTGGTQNGMTNLAHDSNNAAASANVFFYTANPTGLGTSLGAFEQYYLGAPANSGTPALPYNYGPFYGDQSIVLRGTTQFAVINLEGATLVSGETVRAKVKWSEV